MKWYVFIALVGTLTLATCIYIFFGRGDVAVPQPPNSATLPVASSTTATDLQGASSSPAMALITYETRNSVIVTVKDFIHNGETVGDVANPGSYVLAGEVGYCLADGRCPVGFATKNFIVGYNEKTHFFNIILLTEPLGAVRLDVEEFLENRLGIAQKDMCYLDYSVGTPYWVNEVYATKNLGFSFCPGATVLPK